MKKLSVFAVASMIAVGAFAASNEVTSVNAVGFIRTTVAEGGYAYVALAFNNLDGSATATVNDILPKDEYPAGTVVSFFDDGAWQSELLQSQIGIGKAWVPGTNEFIRGDALFVKAPPVGGGIELTLMGEVPAEAASTVLLPTGYAGVGYAYPADLPLAQSSLNGTAVPGDTLSWWDQDQAKWITALYQSEIGVGAKWVPEDVVLEAGRGYFYRNVSSMVPWEELKPYVWP